MIAGIERMVAINLAMIYRALVLEISSSKSPFLNRYILKMRRMVAAVSNKVAKRKKKRVEGESVFPLFL
jgi:hypothetical protein